MSAAADLVSNYTAEVCILGAGPAGCLVARQLARLGHDVIVVERVAQPVARRSESVPLSIAAFLRSVDLETIFGRAAFLRQDASLVLWRAANAESVPARSMLVDRSRLDMSMRKAAQDSGARLLAPARAGPPRRRGLGGWQVPLVTSQGIARLDARFLIDARGRRRRTAIGPPTVALEGSWRPAAFAETRIEAGSNEWFWGSPQPDGSYGASVFVDATLIAGRRGAERLALYRRILARSRLLGALASGEMIGPLRVRDATFTAAPNPIGLDHACVGDAAVALDPLSSQGVQAALRAAVQASAAVHTLLTDPSEATAARDFYRDRQNRAVSDARLAGAEFYSQDDFRRGPFWRARGGVAGRAAYAPPPRPEATFVAPTGCLRVSDRVRTTEVPALVGSRVIRAPALSHPGLAGPVAFVADIPLPPLIALLDIPLRAPEIVQRWSARAAPAAGREILQWMCETGILVT